MTGWLEREEPLRVVTSTWLVLPVINARKGWVSRGRQPEATHIPMPLADRRESRCTASAHWVQDQLAVRLPLLTVPAMPAVWAAL